MSEPLTIAEWDKNRREVIRVRLTEYKGTPLVEARVWYRDDDELKPSRAGLTLSLHHLPQLASAFAIAEQKAQGHDTAAD